MAPLGRRGVALALFAVTCQTLLLPCSTADPLPLSHLFTVTEPRPQPQNAANLVYGAFYFSPETLRRGQHVSNNSIPIGHEGACELGGHEQTMFWFTIDTSSKTCQPQPIALNGDARHMIIDWTPGVEYIDTAGFFCNDTCDLASCNITLEKVPFFECYAGQGYDVMFFDHDRPCFGPVTKSAEASADSYIGLQYFGVPCEDQSNVTHAAIAVSLEATEFEPACSMYSVPGIFTMYYSLVESKNHTFTLSVHDPNLYMEDEPCNYQVFADQPLGQCFIDMPNASGGFQLIDLPEINLCKNSPFTLQLKQSLTVVWGVLGFTTFVIILGVFGKRKTMVDESEIVDPLLVQEVESRTSRSNSINSSIGSSAYSSDFHDFHSAAQDTGYDSDEPLLNPYDDLLPTYVAA